MHGWLCADSSPESRLHSPRPRLRRCVIPPIDSREETASLVALNYIIGVGAIPAGFDRVKNIRALNGGIELVADSGKRAACPLDLGYLGT